MSAPHEGTAPRPPGRLGEAVDPAQVQDYLADLDTWLRDRREELDRLDAHALAAERAEEVTEDMALALASWQAICDRRQLVHATFDGGRVDLAARERISALLWGRLGDATADLPGGLAVSLAEACRLNDALTAQVRTRLDVAPGALGTTARIADLRAQFARIEDQIGLEPDETRDEEVHRLAGLLARLQHIEQKAGHGADVGGLLAPLEVAATTHERDLIVGHARRRDAHQRREDLAQRATALAQLADRCIATVDPAPHYAVPDLAALGPVPSDSGEIAAHLRRLDRVGEALDWAHERYAAALAELDALTSELDTLVARASAAGVAERPDLADAERAARSVLDRRPTPMAVARQLVATYRAWLQHHTGGGRGAP